MIIDSTYFEVKNFIPNLKEPDPNSKKESDLAHYISRAEEEVLSFAFGMEMWEDFKPYVAEGADPSLIPQNYLDILDGMTYVVNGEKHYWKGLRNNVTKESLLADYTYYIYYRDHTSTTTEAGEVAMDNKIGTRVSMSRKLVKAYNSFLSRLHGGVRSSASGWTFEQDPFWVIRRSHDGAIGLDYYGMNGQRGEVSLAQFLFDNATSYPLLDTLATRFGSEYKNEFGI